MSDAFGLEPASPELSKEEMDQLFGDAAPAAETPTDQPQEAAPEESVVPEVPPVEAQETLEEPTEEVPAEETPEEKAERLWAKKYKSPEELERGYQELRDLQRRTAERAKAWETRNQAIEARARELEQAVRRAIPYVQRVSEMQRQNPEAFEGYAEGEQPPLTPEMVAPLVDSLVQQRMQQLQAQYSAQQTAQNAVQEATQALEQFYGATPEVERGGEMDQQMTQTIIELNDAWAESASQLDLGNVETFEIVLEATKDPYLKQVLAIHPELIDTDAGMDLARAQAQQLAVVRGDTQNAQQSPPPTGQPVARKTPVVEKASTGSVTETPKDEFDKAVGVYRQHKRPDGAVFWEG